MTAALDIRSRELKGNRLFNLVMDKVSIFQRNNVNEWDEPISINDIQLFIDGAEWMFTHNANGQINGISKI